MTRAIRYLLPTLLALAAVLVVAGCGGQTSHSAKTRPAKAKAGTGATPAGVSFGVSQDYLDAAASSASETFASRVLGSTGHVRLFVPYDARGYWDGSTCASSPDYAQGASDWDALQQQLLAAQSQHLQVEIVFATGSGAGGVPVFPDPAIPAQTEDYTCGVQMALRSIAAFTAQEQLPMPTQYEAWNEPNLDSYGKGAADPCPSPATSESAGCSGPWQAAMLWYIAQTVANELQAAGTVPRLTFAALTASAPQLLAFIDDDRPELTDPAGTFYDGYYQQLYAIVHCAPGYGGCGDLTYNPIAMPAIWAVHDYADVTGNGTGDLTLFEHTLAQLNNRFDGGHGASIWITEAGVDLAAPTSTDVNHPDGVRCNPNDTDARADSFGCLVDGHPQAQADGAIVWKALPSLQARTRSGSVTVTQLYWYQFELGSLACSSTSPCSLTESESVDVDVPQLHAWDSALVDARGQPRISFCVLTGLPLTECHGRTTDYINAHWIPWWTPSNLPTPCPDEHDGAWVANESGSGVPGGEECYYDVDPEPTTVQTDAAMAAGS
jgi:hypothetical protein